MKQLFRNYIYPISVLTGTIVGVGFFALPYVTMKLGIWIMLAYFLIVGGLTMLIHCLFAELVLITPDMKRFPGFARFYLGPIAEKLVVFSTVVGIFGGVLAYCVVGGEFLTGLLSPIFGGSNLIYTLIYFFIGSLFIFFGISVITKVEFWGMVLRFLILLAIAWQGREFINPGNLMPSGGPDLTHIFLPYGVILFSLWGADLIPEIEEMLGEQKKLIRKIVPLSILIASLIYLFFIYIVLGIAGDNTTPVAITGLSAVLGNGVVSLALVFGLITTFTSFITLGLTLKKVFWYDLKINEKTAWLITCVPPIIVFLLGFNNFISVISFAGGIMLGINGILILWMYSLATKKKFAYALIPVLLAGIIYQIVYSAS